MCTLQKFTFCLWMKKLTPAQQQYADMKKQYPDCLLFFRLGDFYELFHEDAHIAHKVLGITLTARDKTAPDPIPMAGIPHHALERYLPVLIQAWYKVAVADQVGEVIPWKLVERKIVQIYTPWTWVEQWSLSSYIVAVVQYANYWALARGDVTLWVWTTKTCLTREEMMETLWRLAPREIVCDGSVHEIWYIERQAHEQWWAFVSIIPSVQDAEQWLLHTLQVTSLSWYGRALDEWVQQACASLFWYLHDIKQPLCVRRIESWQDDAYVLLDQLTIKNLEVFQWSYNGNKKQSLFGVIDQCKTSMWSRLLAHLLSHPTQDLLQIQDAQHHIQQWYQNQFFAQEVHNLFASVSDLPRIAQQITQKKRQINTLRQLAEQVQHLHLHADFFTLLQTYNPVLVNEIDVYTRDLLAYIQQWPVDEHDWIASGKDQEVDRLRHIDKEVDQQLLDYQQARFSRSGVSVKIKYITNQWYFLEITPKDIKKFEDHIDPTDKLRGAVRAQTLKTGQRYISSYLQELQTQIYSSKENLAAYHQQKCEEMYVAWQAIVQRVYMYADLLAQIDLYSTMALLMHERDWCLPQVTNDPDLYIGGWRHPVVEVYLPADEQFIPNDTLCTPEHFFHLITWPNMGGKSTYMRQQALIVLLAHAGLPVPAKEAKIPCIDWLFARIWSGDVLAKQQSTFMTEMIETATILHHATERSFLIIDELGRWTSTRDGLALAKAITVYICQQIKAKTLFSTHYHELIELAWEVKGIQNRQVWVHETEHEVVFLKKILPWWADKSYWLDVAKLAWIPADVLAIATSYLQESLGEQKKDEYTVMQSSLFSCAVDERIELYDELRELYGAIDVYTITPLDAVRILQEILIKLRK